MAKHWYLEKTGSRKRHKGDVGGEHSKLRKLGATRS